jgi:hypothetical protein
MTQLKQASKKIEAEISRLAALRLQVEAGGLPRQQGGRAAAQDPRQQALASVVSGQLFKPGK